MPEGFSDASQNLNAQDRSFSGLKGSAEARNMEFQGIPQDSVAKLRSALSIFPQDRRPQVGEQMTHYQTSVITPKEVEAGKKHDIGVIFLPGVSGTATNNVVTASALYQELGNSRDIGFALSVSGSISRDTIKDPYIHSIEQRAAEQAALIVEFLKTHPVKELMLVGHSLGGQEIVYNAPLLEKLMQEHGIDTKIGGLVLLNPGGQFDRSWGKFVTKDTPAINRFDREVEEKFPTAALLKNVKEQLTEAREWGDTPSISRLENQLAEMTMKYADPQDLPEDIKAEVIAINNELAQTEDSPTVNSLLKRRHKLLMPVIQSILVGADTRKPQGRLQFGKMVKRGGRATVLRKHPITKQNPSWIRDKDTYPTAVVLGNNDPYFPATQATEMFKGGNIPYPNAPVFDIATVGNGSHIGVAVEPQKYARIAVDLYDKLQHEAGNPTQEPNAPDRVIRNMQIHHY